MTPSAQRVIARSVGGQASFHVTPFFLPRLIVYQRLHALSYSSKSLNLDRTTAFVSVRLSSLAAHITQACAMHSTLSQHQPRMYQPYCNVRQRLRPLRAAGCGSPVPAGTGAATPHASASTRAALASAAAWRCHHLRPTSLRQMANRHGAAQPQAPAAAELRSAAAALRGGRGATLDSANGRAYGRRNVCRCLVDSTALPVAQPQQLRELGEGLPHSHRQQPLICISLSNGCTGDCVQTCTEREQYPGACTPK